ncbi:MAG TPA: 4-hydroxy-tetrahydrodipicolinate synthase [Acidimicrobiales bacterium]|nr:4-hydroxy-tetrahydrodipicolinate synthase [Acidimicrobiales bacterium]
MRFRAHPASIRGSIAPVVTPFAADGALDLESLRKLVAWQLDSGSQGISVGGSTGEPGAQTLEERAAVIRAAASEVADAVPFVPGTGSAKLDETLRLTTAAAEAGADAVLVITPYYACPTQEGLYQWYARVATAHPGLPIIIYNVPSRTAVNIAPATVASLFRDFENIVGLKETTRDFEHASRVIQQAGPDILVWSGIELLCLPLLALGGAGFVSAVANIAPAAIAEMYRRWEAGDQRGACHIHYALHPLVDLVFVETNPGPVKWVLEQAGIITSGFVRLPLVEPAEESRARIRQFLAAGSELLARPVSDLIGRPSEVPARAPEVVA